MAAPGVNIGISGASTDTDCFVFPDTSSASESVQFSHGAVALKLPDQQRLQNFVAKLRNLPEQSGVEKIIVLGFADRSGSEFLNNVLMKRRAEAVKGYLVAQGVPERLIHAIIGRDSKGVRFWPVDSPPLFQRSAEVIARLEILPACRKQWLWPHGRDKN